MKNINSNNAGKSALTSSRNQGSPIKLIADLPVVAFNKAGQIIAGHEYLETIVRTGKSAKLNVVYGLDSVEELVSKLAA